MNIRINKRLNKQNIERGISYLKRNGLYETFYKALERLKRDDEEEADYERLFTQALPSEQELKAQRMQGFTHRYKISILVPAYETDPEFLIQMLESVIYQTYDNWELCIADGSRGEQVKQTVMDVIGKYGDITGGNRIKYRKLEKNLGISENTNAALLMATGEYIGLLDHDDLLSPDALYEVMSALEAGLYKDGNVYQNRICVLYSDEDKIDAAGGRYFDYHKKPDFDMDLLRSNNYICHFFVVRAEIAEKTGGFLSIYNGAQDHDFIFRCVENLPPDMIYHIPKVLYHWRAHETSTADNPESKIYAYEAGKRAIEDHLKRMHLEAEVFYTPHLGFFRVRYKAHDLRICLLSKEAWDALTGEDVDRIKEPYIMILSDKIKPLTADWQEELAGNLERSEVGAVGGKIYDRRFCVESAGYTKNKDGRLVPNFRGMNGHYSGYLHRASLQQRVDGVALDCMMIKKAAIEKKEKPVMSKNYIVVYDPYAKFKRK